MTDTPRLLDHTVSQFARRLASSDPTPGGGSAAALCAALGASLVAMVARLTAGRPAYAEHDEAARRISDTADEVCAQLLDLIETDAAAYDAVVTARRMPRDDDAAERRAAAVRAALEGAIRAPLRIAALAADVLQLAEQIASFGNRNALSDVAVAGDLAWAGLRGGLANVAINVPGLAAEDPLRAELAPRVEELERHAARGVAPLRAALEARQPA